MEQISDIYIFLGRFHALFVHLPIGFISLAILLEIGVRWMKFERYMPVIPFLWMLAAISSIVSVALGYSLSLGGGYDEETLYWHRLGGFCLIGVTLACSFLTWSRLPVVPVFGRPLYLVFVAAAAVLLVITGHNGGSLTHGNTYLTEFAPAMLGGPKADTTQGAKPKGPILHPDSADIFKDAVLPILQTKCASCHNTNKKKGDLLVGSYEEIFKGGKSGQGIVPGNLATSELFRRVSLPHDHKEFMPSGGKTPLTDQQLAILEWWIETGAQKTALIGDLHPNKKMQDIFADFFQVGRDPILDLVVPAEDPKAVAALLKKGFQVNQLTQNKHLFEVKRNGPVTEKTNVEDLLPLKDQLVWLQLSNSGITDADLKIIGSLPNLYKLNLSRNAITNQGVQQLAGLSKLEYLNLYETAITDSGIIALTALPKLKKLYVWGTAADSVKMAGFTPARKDLEIVYKLQ